MSTSPPVDELTSLRDSVDHWQTVSDDLRDRAGAAAKIFAAVATAGTTAIGFARIDDVFPFPSPRHYEDWLALVGAVGGISLMAIAVFVYAARFFKIGRAVIVRANPDLIGDVTESERQMIREVFDETAAINGAATLAAYEHRGQRLEMISSALHGDLADSARQQAALIRAEIDVMLARARVWVVRRRVNNAVTDGIAKLVYVGFVVGLISFALGTDYLKAENARATDRIDLRTKQLDFRKACVDLAAKTDVSTICPGVKANARSPSADDAVTQKAIAQARKERAAEYASCLGKNGPAKQTAAGETSDPCRPILIELKALLE